MPNYLPIIAAAWRDRRGLAALEFSLAAPVLVLLLVGVVDLGRAIDQSIRLETAARGGAQYAMSFPDDLPGISKYVAASLAGQPNIHAPEVTMACECPAAAGATAIADPGCTNPCTGRRQLLTIVVRQDFNAIFKNAPYFKVTTLTGNATLSIQ